MNKKIKQNLADIKLLVLDVDGVLTDGGLIINSDGSESKIFNTRDGHGMRLWQRAGLKIAFLSARTSEPTTHRAEQLQIDHCLQECHYKLPALKELLKNERLSPENVAYIGDDLTDLPPIRFVAFGVTVPDAPDELKQHADYITTSPGGKGAVREVIELILKTTDKWPQLMERYLQ